MLRSAPPIPEEYKGLTPAPPPPSPANATTRSRPNSQVGARSPAAPSTPGRSASQANRAPPPTPNMAEIESARNATPGARPPTQPKQKMEDLDALETSRAPFFIRKTREYKQKIVQCQKSRHALERAIICFVAVCLLWLTSLALCQAIVNTFIKGPDPHQWSNAVSKSMEITAEEKKNHDACATRLTDQCKSQISSAISLEKLRVNATLTRNAELIEFLYVKRDQCRVQVDAGVGTLAYLQRTTSVTDPAATYPTPLTSTDPRCQLVEEILKGGSGGIQALGATDRYVGDADDQIVDTFAALEARQNYDQQYLINKTQELDLIANTTLLKFINESEAYFRDLNRTYDMFMACISPTRTYKNETCPSASVLSTARDMQLRAQARYDSMRASALNYYNNAKARIDQVNAFCNNLMVNDPLRSAMNVFLNLNGFPDLEGMGLTTMNILPSLSIPPLGLADLNAKFAQFETQSQEYLQAMVENSQRALQEQLRLQQACLNFSVANPFPPYDPPPVDDNGTISGWRNRSGVFVSEMANSLEGAVNKGSTQASEFLVNNNLTNGTEPTPAVFLNNLQQRALSFSPFEAVSIDQFTSAWDALISTALTFDYLFRAFHTLQIIRKYWRVSAIDTPPADVRTDLMQNKGLAVGHQNFGQKVLMCLAHPATMCIAMLALSTAIFILMVNLYLPIYINYRDGCVNDPNTWNGKGTMISRNAYGLSYSYAMSEGDKTTTIAVDRINADREVQCTQQVDYSSKAYEMQEKEWDFIRRDHVDNKYRAFTINDCIDIPQIQSDFTTVAGVATEGNFTSLLQMIPGPSCNYTFPPLENAVFNCSKVVCQQSVLCVGANQNLIRFNTFKASCYTEWYIHAALLGSIMVTVVFILVNCSRILVLRGLVRMLWRYLSDGRFSYLGTCDRSGELRYPSIITEKGYSMKRAIRESLAYRIMYWEAKSTSLFIFGVFINVPWMFALGYLSRNLAVNDLESIDAQ